MAFNALFSPIRIGSLELKNRIALSPMMSGQAGPEHKVTDGHIDWYGARAKGGVGLIITEITSVDPLEPNVPTRLSLWDESFVPGFARLVESIHAHETKVFIQLYHSGRKAPLEPRFHEIPEEFNIERIQQTVQKFSNAARLAKEAGFDGLEIHGAHGYLIAKFMSAYSNKRHDQYGGELASRLRFPLEVIKSVRRAVGRDFPISFRFSGNEHIADGRTIDESVRIARVLEEAGVDCLHISAGTQETFWAQIPPYGIPEGVNANDAAAIKQAVNIPVIAVGRIKSPEIAEEILQQGKADMVALGRQLICDPDWPRKVAAGDLDDIRPCIGCTQGCINREKVEGKEAACIYNTAAGREKEAEIIPAKKKKRVVIVGGGPGGLEAARIAALRGHQVTLFEKAEKLGGRFNLACVPPFKQEFVLAIKWLARQVEKSGVQVELGREVTPELLAKIKPDVVIIATGATTKVPNIPGINREGVVIADDILAGKVNFSSRVAVLGGGGIGCEVADFIAQRGKQVTIIEEKPEIGIPTGIPMEVTQILLSRLHQYGVRMITRASVKKITSDGILVTIDGKDEILSGIDQIVIAMGGKAINDLSQRLKGKVPELYVIGDAKEPRTTFEATHEGAEVARMI